MANLERQLAARLLAGRIDQTTYQKAMADLAHDTVTPSVHIDNAVVVSAGDPRALGLTRRQAATVLTRI